MKKIFRMALVCALAGATLLYTGCTKDYSDDINDLKKSVSDLETTVSQLNAAITAGSVITNVQRNSTDDGWVITLSNGKPYEVKDGKNGTNGTNGSVVTIGTDGYWYIDDVKQEVKAVGDKGDKGDDGLTPYIKDGYWWIGDKNTTVKAEGVDGKDGANGTNGTNGLTPYIKNGNWWIGDTDLKVKAQATAVSINEDGYICLDGVATNVKAGSIAVWDQTTGTVKVYGADGEIDFEIGVCELESIVFVPQLYFEGIEAARYNYFYGNYNEADADAAEETTDDESKAVVAIPVAGFPHAFAETEDVYSIGEIAEAEYHVNPNSFDLTKADFELQGVTKQTMSRADGSAATQTWKPVLKSIARPEAGKNAVITYQIENAHLATGMLPDITTSAFAEDEFEGNSDVAVMRLRGTVKAGNKAVDSDYEAIVPFREELHHLAFTQASGYETEFSDTYFYQDNDEVYPYHSCSNEPNEDSELYTTSMQAMEQAPSVKLNYLDTLDILKIIAVHYHPAVADAIHTANADKEEAVSLEEFLAANPGLTAEYQLIGYKLGEHATREDMYGKIEGSKFFPCWVDEDGKTQYKNADKVGGYDGKSSVNRKPIVLVTLKDANGVLLYGYFKIQITKEATPLHKDFIIKEFPAFPYVCSGSVKTTWAECSSIVLEKNLGMTYMEFKDRYVKEGTSPDGKTYVKTAEGFKEEYKYGEFVFSEDKKISAGTNDVFGIEVSTLAQVDSIAKNGPVTLYTKFGTSSDYVYIGLTISVGNKPAVTTIKHNPSYWFTPAGHDAADLVIVNPRVPDNGYEDTSWGEIEPSSMNDPAWVWPGANSTITGYSINLEKAWTPNRVQFVFDEATQKAYAEAIGLTGKVAFGTAKLPINYHFEFNQNQTCKPEGKTLKVKAASENTQYLYWNDDTKLENIIACISTQNVRTYNDIVNVPTGVRATKDGKFANVDMLYYKHDGTKDNTVAKRILNEYTHPAKSDVASLEESLDKFLYADVDLVATYGTCNIPLTTESFHVAFFRPLDIKTKDVEGFKDATKGGDKLVIGSVFNVTDWQGLDIFVKDEDGNYQPNVSKDMTKGNAELNWADFYGVTSIKLNLAEIKTDQNGNADDFLYSHGNIEGVNDSFLLSVVAKAGASDESKAALTSVKNSDAQMDVTYTIDLTSSYDALNDIVLCYSNYTVVQNFNIYVPITVNYWWGELKGTVKIPVGKTI